MPANVRQEFQPRDSFRAPAPGGFGGRAKEDFVRAFLIAISLASVLAAGPALAQDNQAQNSDEKKADEPKALTTEDTRLTTGVELVSPASSKAQQHFLLDFMVTAPLGDQVKRKTKPVLGAWFNARFSGSTANSVSNVKQFVGGFQDDFVSGDIGTLLNSLTFRGGLEVKVPKVNGFDFFDDFQFQPVFLVAFGVQTVPALEKAAVFDLPAPTNDPGNPVADLPYTRWGIPKDKGYKYVALSGPDRRQFFGSYDVGIRFKSHHFKCSEDKDECDRRLNFPGMIDLTVGRDEAITGGQFRGVVGKIDAFYPLPTDNLANAIYFFGSARMHRRIKLGDDANGNPQYLPAEEAPVILHAPEAVVPLPNPEVFVHVLTPDERTRDEWKFGIGVDLMRLITASATARANDAASAAKENGSIKKIDENSDLLIQRRVIQPDELVTFNHGVDAVIPTSSAALQGYSIPVGGSGPINYTKDEVRPEIATKRQVKNTTMMNFEMVQVKVKGGEGKATMPDVKEGMEKVVSRTDEPKYRISKVTCPAAPATCTYGDGADVDNSVAIVAITPTTYTSNGKTVMLAPYEGKVIPRKTGFAITGNPTFAIVRVP